MSIQWNKMSFVELFICVAIPLLAGGISSALTRNSMVTFVRVAKPPFAPPGWLFPIAWTILYIMMGIASFAIQNSYHELRMYAIALYFVQLIFNFTWSLIFFRAGTYTFAAIWLGIMLVMIITLVIMCRQISMLAFWLLLPYAVWCCYALYLNVGIAVLNR